MGIAGSITVEVSALAMIHKLVRSNGWQIDASVPHVIALAPQKSCIGVGKEICKVG